MPYNRVFVLTIIVNISSWCEFRDSGVFRISYGEGKFLLTTSAYPNREGETKFLVAYGEIFFAKGAMVQCHPPPPPKHTTAERSFEC